MTLTITTNRELEATALAPDGAIAFNAERQTAANGPLASDAQFANALRAFFSRGHVVSIAGRPITQDTVTRLLAVEPATEDARQGFLRESLGLPNLNYDNVRRLLDDVMRSHNNGAPQEFAVSMAQAAQVGLVSVGDSREEAAARYSGQTIAIATHAPSVQRPGTQPMGNDRVRQLIRDPHAAADATQLLRTSDTSPGAEAFRRVFADLTTFARSPAQQPILPELLRQAVGAARANDDALVHALGALAGNAHFAALPLAMQQQIVRMSAARGAEVCELFRALCDRAMPDGNSVLDAMDHDLNTVFDQIVAMDSAPIAPALVANQQGLSISDLRQRLFTALLEHLANPHAIDQSTAGTCGLTSVQYGLAQNNPVTYARMAVALVRDGAFNAAGLQLLAAPEALGGVQLANRTDRRDLLERLTQTAFIRVHLPGYDPANDRQTSEEPIIVNGRRYGTQRVNVSGSGQADIQQLYRLLLARASRAFTDPAQGYQALTTLGAGDAQVAFDHWINDHGSVEGAHALTFVRVDPNGDVILRNPQGAHTPGPVPHGVPARVNEGEHGDLVRVTRAVFIGTRARVVVTVPGN